MGSTSNIILSWYAIFILNFSNFPSFSLPLNNNNNTHIIKHNTTNLDDYLYNYSSNSLPQKPQTGVLYNISDLPSNFSGMQVSILRLRSSTLWSKGANFSYFDIPPKIITMSYVKRLAIMYENFGNLSSYYYNVPGYTFLTKVVGFAVYNASDLSGKSRSKRLNLTLEGNLIIKVKFSQALLLSSSSSQLGRNNNNTNNNKLKKCVRFDPLSGLVELGDMLRPNVCSSQSLGHFAIIMPTLNESISSPSPSPPLFSSKGKRKRKKTIALWIWWLVGFVAAIITLVMLALCFVYCYKIIGSRKIKRMERIAEKSESLDIKWIGNSKFPFAPVSRTQAVLEEDLAP